MLMWQIFLGTGAGGVVITLLQVDLLAERVEEYQAGEAEREAAREKAKEGYQRQQRRGATA